VKFREGDRILLLTGAADRDPAEYPNPDVVDSGDRIEADNGPVLGIDWLPLTILGADRR